MPRVVGLDVGERRIGVAISDPTGMLARPLGVLACAALGKAAVALAAQEIARLGAEDDGVASIVVGLPRHLDGTPSDMTMRVSVFARRLEARTHLPVSLQDERLTSREAESRLARHEKDWRVRKQHIDATAAAIILQDYLDGVPRPILDADPHGHLMHKRTLALIFVFVVVFVVGTPVLVGTVLWVRMTEPYKGYDAVEQIVEIPPGTGTTAIGERLVAAGVVRDRWLFRAAVWWTGRGRDLKAGEYRFDRPLSTIAVLDIVGRGEVYTRRLTFPEGLNVREMAQIYQARGFGQAAEFMKAAADATRIHDLDPAATDLEGYLFPDTYTLPRATPATGLVGAMLQRFRAAFTPDLIGQAKAQGLTVREVMALAALIEKETAQASERPLVAAVYRNRLRVGMPMQADPTVVYALQLAGRYDGNIRRADLEIDSPYNTYRYPGLPPGPIAAPGAPSLRAALAPADVDYLYFVSRNDGSHVFAATLAEHNANVQKYQIEYFRAQRRAAAARGAGAGGR